MTIYPTEWKIGKVRGSIKNQGNTYFVRYNDSTGKTQSQYFLFSKFGGQENALKQANTWLEQENMKHNISINKTRYLDKNTIEVNINDDINFTTDAIFLDKVNEYKIYIKEKKEKNGIVRKYVMCQIKKQAFTFVSKICNFKIVKYIDGNPLNLKLSNLAEFGAIDNSKQNLCVEYDAINTVEISCFNINPFLPKNKWILGKPSGTIFKRETENGTSNIWTVSITDEHSKQHTKTFNIENYNSDTDAKTEGLKWLYDTSCKLNLTKNLIRLIDDEYIEVSLSKNMCLLIDKVFLPLIELIPLCVGKSGTIDSNYYCQVSVNSQTFPLHRLIMGNIMVDHLNNNTLDNRLINLMWTNYSQNNRNRITNDENTGTRLQQRDELGLFTYEARTKVFGKEYSKMFHFKKDDTNGKYIAEKNAKTFRKNIYEINIDVNELEFTGKESVDDLSFLIKRLTYVYEKLKTNCIYNPSEYLKDINLTDRDRRKIHQKYLHIIFWRMSNLEQKMEILKQYVDEIGNPKLYTFENNVCYSTQQSIKTYEELKNMIVHEKSTTSQQSIYKNNNTFSKSDINDLQHVVSLKNGILITLPVNIKSEDTQLSLICKNEHDFNLTFKELMKDCKWCENCNYNSKGENKIKEICKKIFNEQFIKCRPDWLRSKHGTKLELDLYCEKLGIAFEYNGQQHYVFVPLYHSTEEEFKKLQEHDKTKERLCKKNNVTLIIIPYTIKLNDIEKYILEKIKNNNITPLKNTPEIIDRSEKIQTKVNFANKYFDKAIEIIEQKCGTYVDGTYLTRDSDVTIECEHRHKWTTNFGKILSGSWCHTCGLSVSNDSKVKISCGVKSFNESVEGKELKKKSLEKRSQTMKLQRENLQSDLTHKNCKHCATQKEVSAFNKKSDTKDGLQPYCKECINKIKQEKKLVY